MRGHLIRPMAVIGAQLHAAVLSLLRRSRVVTYTTQIGVPILPTRVHYVRIGLEDGTVIYHTPYLSPAEYTAIVSALDLCAGVQKT